MVRDLILWAHDEQWGPSMSSSWMATLLDQEQIEVTNTIEPRTRDIQAMPDRSGEEVAEELGKRLLVRYLAPWQVSEFTTGGSTRHHWVTPTPIAPDDVVSWLALFAPNVKRKHALILDPAQIPLIRGPAWIRLGQGIEYYLPDGFPSEAVMQPGTIQVR